MFENLRSGIARAITPKAAQIEKNRLNLASTFTPGMPIYSDMTVRRATREGYKMSVYVYRAVRTIIQSASSVPWVALDADGLDIPDHPFVQLMNKPNPEFAGQDIIELLIGHLCLCGNALWQPLIVNGILKEIWPVMPDLVQPIPSEIQGKWIDGYYITLAGGGGQRTVPPETFIHFMQTDPGDPYWGIGPLMAAARTVDTDNEAQDTQKVSMQNRGVPSGILSPTDSELSPDEFEEARKRFKDTFSDKLKRREPWLLNKGMKWEQMSLSAVEMDYIASRLTNKRDIAAAFGLSPIFLGDLDQSSYNNMAEARRSLYQDVVIPMLDDIKYTIQLKIAPMYNDGAVLTYDLSNVAALREDFAKKTTSAQTLWAMGVPFAQINSKLELGFEEFEGWDRSYLPFNLMPSGSATTPNGAVKANKAYQADTEEQKAALWRRQDLRRQGWWAVIGKKVAPLYDDESAAVISALERGDKNAADAIDSTSAKWLKTLKASYTAVIEDIGTQTARDLGMKPKSQKDVFDPFSAAAIKWIKSQAGLAVTSILDTDKQAVADIILNGFKEGLGIPEISKSIRQFYADNSPWKAARVARTETAKAAGFASHEAATQSGVVQTKKWLTARDNLVRDSHQALEGESVPLDDTYSNGLSFPGDPSGEAADVINCRCTELYGF